MFMHHTPCIKSYNLTIPLTHQFSFGQVVNTMGHVFQPLLSAL